MIVVSAGLQKSGSGLFFNLTNDLLIETGNHDVRKLKSQYQLEDLLRFHNCNIGTLERQKIEKLQPLHDAGYSFVIKTHEGPTPFLGRLVKKDIVKVTCIYRDPRDVIISAIDHGKKIRDQGDDHTFALYHSIRDTLPQVKKWLDHGIMKWLEEDNIFIIKYEDLMKYPIIQLKRLGQFLHLDMSRIKLPDIWNRYNQDKMDPFQKDILHFNIGVPGRFRTVMSNEDANYCTGELSPYLTRMGYSI